jgi:DNA replication protein DnaC
LTLSLDSWVLARLLEIGLGEGEAEASLEMIPQGIRRALPPIVIERMAAGQLPATGFGLGGEIGWGKTFTLAALIRASLLKVAEFRRETVDHVSTVAWACWPVDKAVRGTLDQSRERLEHLANAPLLVLDDLGRERLKGSYGDDWSRSCLDVIVTQRCRRRLPILWTTNCSFQELLGIYGPGLVSRLSEINPFLRLEGLRNLRRV